MVDYRSKNNMVRICLFRKGHNNKLVTRATIAFNQEEYIFGYESGNDYKIIMFGKVALVKDNNDAAWQIAVRRREE